jgi:hypothetical protein
MFTSFTVRRGLSGCGVAQRVRRGSVGCGVAQIVARRLAVRQARVQISEEARAEAMKRTEVVLYEYINIVYLLEIKKSGSVSPNPKNIYKQVSVCP